MEPKGLCRPVKNYFMEPKGLCRPAKKYVMEPKGLKRPDLFTRHNFYSLLSYKTDCRIRLHLFTFVKNKYVLHMCLGECVANQFVSELPKIQ
jgi:hypothetical protein